MRVVGMRVVGTRVAGAPEVTAWVRVSQGAGRC